MVCKAFRSELGEDFFFPQSLRVFLPYFLRINLFQELSGNEGFGPPFRRPETLPRASCPGRAKPTLPGRRKVDERTRSAGGACAFNSAFLDNRADVSVQCSLLSVRACGDSILKEPEGWGSANANEAEWEEGEGCYFFLIKKKVSLKM